MKRTLSIAVLLSLFIFSVSWANETTLKQAYSLYYKGDREAAISMIEDLVEESPDANAFYFLGYVYYEMKEMEKAREYFDQAYRLKSFFSPMPSGEEK